MTLKSKAAAFAAIGLFAIAAAAQEGAVLRHTFKEGASDVYTISSSTKASMKGGPTGDSDDETSTSSTLTISYKKVNADGSADVEKKSEPGEIKGTGMVAQMMSGTKLDPVVTTGKLDTRNTFTIDKETGGNGMQKLLMSGGFSPEDYAVLTTLPDKAVKIGDTWPLTVRKSIFLYASDQTLTAKLTGEKDVDGVKAWIVTIEGKLKVEPQMSEVKKQVPEIEQQLQGAEISVHGNMDIKTESLFDKATGRSLGCTGTLKGDSKFEIPSFSVTMTSSSTTDLKITLKK